MNKRNHPYFHSVAEANSVTTSTGGPYIPVKSEAQHPMEPYPYTPRMAQLLSPRWIDNQNYVEYLSEMIHQTGYKKDTGYHIDDHGYLYSPATGDEACGGLIAGMAVVSDKETSSELITGRTHIMNTEDCGLRHVHMTKNGMAMDLGPVETTCFIGNINRPEGIYVPMCNTRAMADGITILTNLLEEATANDADLPKLDLVDMTNSPASPVPFKDDDHHECACGGACKCGGKCKCGGNCKCKKNKK